LDHQDKPGKSQTFTSCDFFVVDAGEEKWVANGQSLLVVVQTPQ